MKFTVDYEHIFFDRYVVNKKNEAEYILQKAFDEIGCMVFINNNEIVVEAHDLEAQVKTDDVIKLLKLEFFILLKEYEEIEETVVKDSFAEAVQYIRERYLEESLTVEEICQSCSMNRSALDRIFADKADMSASEYIRHIRVEKAKELVALGERMETIASLCGFGSVKTMQRAFKAVYGRTPAEYRMGKLDSKEQE